MRTEGSRAFDRILIQYNVGLTAAGAALGCSASTVLDLRRGRKRPKLPLAARVKAWTRGEIGLDLWMTPKERDEAERQPPISAANAAA